MLKKFSLFKKIKKIPLKTKLNQNQTSELPTLPNEKSRVKTDFAGQKELDKKLVYSLNKKKIPSLKQLKYLPQVLNPKQRLIIRGLTVLIFLCLLFIATNFYLRNFLPTPTVGGQYSEGLIGAPQYINPLLCQTNDVDSDISRLIFSGLLKYDKELQLIPDLAASWQTSEDQKTFTFVLKDNISWHDGQPLTADDVVFTFQSIRDPDFKSPLLISFRGVEIEKVDEKTVKFILPEPYPAFLEVLTAGILPEHIWGEIPPINANLTEYNFKPIGSGPWKFEKLAKDRPGNIKSYTLIPNPDYYGQKPYLEKITFKFYPDFPTAVGALKNHSVEGISFLPKELKNDLSGQKNLSYYSFYLPQYTAIFFNQKQKEVLKDKKIRTALALSIDKSKILTEALQLEGEILDGPILPATVSLSPDKKINFNPILANQTLEEAGWKQISPQDYQNFLAEQKAKEEEENKASEEESENKEEATTTPETIEEKSAQEGVEESQPFYRQKDNTILELILTTVDQPENTKAAELIKEFWQNIGVKVNLQIVPGSKIRREIIKTRNYEILLFGVIVGSSADPYPFWHSSQIQDPGLNLSLFANREVDKLLEEAKKTNDPEKQQQNYQQFYNILASEIPAIFLHTPTYTYVIDKKIKGINIDRVVVPADRFNNLEDWYIKTKWVWQGKLR